MIPYRSIRINAAFPNKYLGFDDTGKNIDIIEKGMSKRFFAACMAMQGLLMANRFEDAKDAYIIADLMLKQEGEQ